MPALLQDLKHSARMFRRAPGFTIAAIAALALGIATNAAIFPVVNTVLLQPLAYPDPGRIVMFQNTFRRGVWTGSASPTEFNWWRQRSDVFQYIAAYDFGVANLTGESLPQQIAIMHVSADFLPLCGLHAQWGRTFTPADDIPKAPNTLVLAYPFWQSRFGGDPQAIGRRITVGGERYEIIGVIAPSRAGGQIAEQSLGSGDLEINEPPDVYLPFRIDPDSADLGHSFNVAGRLKPRVTLAAANAQLQAGYPEYARKWPGDSPPGMGFAVQPLQDAIAKGVRKPLLILLGSVGFVLLIACANVANLLLARAGARKREIAIRAAVGAGRGRIVRQLLTESVMLSLAAGSLGLAAGYAGIRAILKLSPGGIPRIGPGGSNVNLDWRVLSFTLALSIVTGILFGLVPALESSRTDLASTRRHDTRTWTLLVATEMALALVLLIGAALLIRTFIAIRRVNPGFDPQHVLTLRTSLTGPQFESPASASRVIREGLRRIRALRGVEAAAATCCVPTEDRLRGSFSVAGRPEGPAYRDIAGRTVVSAGYFETFRIPILRGRTFTDQDHSRPPVVVINQSLAKRYWPDSDPLQDQIVMGDGVPRRIVGVVGDVRDDALHRSPRPNIYELSDSGNGMLKLLPWAWVIRTRATPLSLSSAIQAELQEATGGLPVARVRSMEEVLSRSTAAQDFNALVLTIFGCSAVLLAAIGIYGLMAYSVSQRTREIGIRVALGAESGQIRSMVILQMLWPALTGIACGLITAFALTRILAGFLFGVEPRDPVVFFVIPIIMAGIALASAWLPAVRASRLDPIHALRSE